MSEMSERSIDLGHSDVPRTPPSNWLTSAASYQRRAQQHRPADPNALAAEIRRQHRENGLSVVGIACAFHMGAVVISQESMIVLTARARAARKRARSNVVVLFVNTLLGRVRAWRK